MVEMNRITNNYIGVSIYDSKENMVFSNTIELSNYYGIYFCRSINNVVYHNNFLNNTNQAFCREENIFDNGYPSGGNYWSDYAGVDLYSGPYQNETGGDGIGDSPYPIGPVCYNVDRYPLTYPWTPMPLKVFDVICDGTHYPVAVRSNSTVTHFIFNQTLAQISFNVSGSSGAWGYCNVTIPKSLMKGPWTYTFLGDVSDVSICKSENETHTFISLKYKHASTFQVIIKASWVVPEFPSATLLIMLILAITSSIVIFEKKKSNVVKANITVIGFSWSMSILGWEKLQNWIPLSL
jgi:parallel beta-helix repeat protein